MENYWLSFSVSQGLLGVKASAVTQVLMPVCQIVGTRPLPAFEVVPSTQDSQCEHFRKAIP